jgi:hypothetical protein
VQVQLVANDPTLLRPVVVPLARWQFGCSSMSCN